MANIILHQTFSNGSKRIFGDIDPDHLRTICAYEELDYEEFKRNYDFIITCKHTTTLYINGTNWGLTIYETQTLGH